MLRSLLLRDFVIVDGLELDLGGGFTALTGETGAGKSILVDALGLVLGERAEASVVRTGAERADISAEFVISRRPQATSWLAEHDLEDDTDCCLLRRTVDRSGRSRAFVNGRPVTVAQLRELGEMLVDVHGQHEHQWLLRRDYQRELLDAFAGSATAAKAVAALHSAWRQLREQRLARERDRESADHERAVLRDEIRDLEALSFDPARWQDDVAEHRRLAHAGELIALAREALAAVDEGEANAGELLARASTQLTEATALDPSIEQARNDLASAAALASEAAHQLRRYLQGIDEDPGRLDQLDRRLRDVHDAARRLRVEPALLADALDSRQRRFRERGGGESDEALARQEAQAEADYRKEAAKLSEARRSGATRLSKAVTDRLQELAMEGGRFTVRLEALPEPAASGLESVEFLVSAHAGQAVGPLAKVASGGELSRIALSIQVLLGGGAGVPTLVFDEVDTGIGGRVAEIVGSLLAELSAHHQVLCVTHLPQVAARAAHQIRVSKRSEGGATLARVEPLAPPERIEEIARMLGGTRITETTRKHAAEMLGSATPQASKMRLRNRA